MDVDVLAQAELIGETAAAVSKNACAVGFIEQERGAKAILQLHDLAEWSEVAVHAEDRFGDDIEPGCGMFLPGPRKLIGEVSEVVMTEDAQGGTAQTSAVHEAGVTEFVQKNYVALGGEGLQGAGAGGVTTAEEQGGGGVFEGSKFLLAFVVRGLRSRNEARGPGAGAEAAGGFERGGHDLRVRGEAEVIVRREVVQVTAVEIDFGSGRRRRHAEPAAQMP